jgi:hypothetical protein
MFHPCFLKAGAEANIAWFLAADFEHYRKLQAFGYVLGFFAVDHVGCPEAMWFKEGLLNF